MYERAKTTMGCTSKGRRSEFIAMDRKPMRRCIYIASPYSIGDLTFNVRVQLDAFERIMNMGHLPFAPLLDHFQHLVHPRSDESWIHDYCLPWVERCDLILRLPGVSVGADLEVSHAIRHGVEPCFGWGDLEVALVDLP
jgi:hypothetical protein